MIIYVRVYFTCWNSPKSETREGRAYCITARPRALCFVSTREKCALLGFRAAQRSSDLQILIAFVYAMLSGGNPTPATCAAVRDAFLPFFAGAAFLASAFLLSSSSIAFHATENTMACNTFVAMRVDNPRPNKPFMPSFSSTP